MCELLVHHTVQQGVELLNHPPADDMLAVQSHPEQLNLPPLHNLTGRLCSARQRPGIPPLINEGSDTLTLIGTRRQGAGKRCVVG